MLEEYLDQKSGDRILALADSCPSGFSFFFIQWCRVDILISKVLLALNTPW